MPGGRITIKIAGDASEFDRDLRRSLTGAKAQVEKYEKILASSQRKAADEAGRLRVAEEQLAEAQSKSTTKASQLAAAEEKLARARRNSAAADNTVRDLERTLADARTRLDAESEKAGEDAGRRAGTSFGREFGQRSALSINQSVGLWTGVIVAAAPVAGAALAAGITGGFIAVSAAAASTSVDVRESFASLKNGALTEVRALGTQTGDIFVHQLDRINASFVGVGTVIAGSVRQAEPAITSLTGGIIDLGGNALPGLLHAVRNSGPTFAGLRQFLGDTGTAAGDLGDTIAGVSQEAGLDFVHLGTIVGSVLGTVNDGIAGATRGFAHHGGEITTTVTNIDQVVTNLGSGAFPILGKGVSFVLGSLNGLLGVLGATGNSLGTVTGIALTTWAAFRVGRFAVGVIENLGVKIDGFSDRLGGANTRAGRFATALGTLTTVGAGPLGIALGVVATGLALFGVAQSRAAQHTAENKQAVQSLTSALEQSNGALDENVRHQIASNLQNKDLEQSSGNAADAFTRLGFSLSDVTGAVARGGPQLEAMRTRLRGIVAAQTKADTSGRGYGATLTAQGHAAQELLTILNDQVGNYKNAQKAQQDLATASETLLSPTDQLGQAQAELASAFGDSAKEADAYKTVLDALTGKTADYDKSTADLHKLTGEIADRFAKGADHANGFGRAIFNLDGSINTASLNAQQLAQDASQLQKQFAATQAATVDFARANKNNVPQAIAQSLQSYQSSRSALIAEARQLGATRQQAQLYADQILGTPEQAITKILTPGMPNAQQAMDILRGKVLRVPNDHTIITKALTQDSINRLQALGFRVTHLPNGQVRVSVRGAAAAESTLQHIARPRDTTIAVHVNQSGVSFGRFHTPFAQGGIVERFAGGGVRRLSPAPVGIAAIDPPNSWRLRGGNRISGDRPQDDEFYIPDNSDPRSLALLGELVRRRGFALVRAFAAGAIATSGRAAVAAATPAAPVTIANTYLVRDDESAYVVGKVASAEMAWQLRRPQ